MKKKYYKLLILSLALLALAVTGIYNELAAKDESEISITNSDQNIEIVVHISGGVESEGVYKLRLGSRVGELLDQAGGLKADGDVTNVNLAEQLKDGQKVYIPTIEAKKENTSDEKIADSNNKIEGLSIEEFNVFSIGELEKLPGVGPVLAKNIYEYRNKNGSFMSVDDLINVSGIGEKKLDAIKACFK